MSCGIAHYIVLLVCSSRKTVFFVGGLNLHLEIWRVTVLVSVSPPLKKRMCSGIISSNSKKCPFEALSRDILVQALCGVDHKDLKQLFHVSKMIREVTMMAKEHFDICTPKTFAFLNPFCSGANGFKEIETPKVN
ncbi:hypothetical protein AAZV13_13G211100 [Glycine max]